MKQFILILLIGVSSSILGQQTDYNTKKGFVADGFDVVSYFYDKNPIKGNKKHQTVYDRAKFKFSSENFLAMFKENPKKYIPQYGGWCAYAVATKGEKVSINPKTFEIRDGKLYLFYNSWGTNTLKSWKKEGGTKTLKEKADENWNKIKLSK